MAFFARGVPSIKVDEYRWRPAPDNPALQIRRACAAEALFGIEASNRRGENDFFIAATVRFHDSSMASKALALREVERKTQSSLVRLRMSQPQIAVTLSWDEQGKCMLQYRAPADTDEAQRWAAGIIATEASQRGLIEMRDRAEEEKRRVSNATTINNAIMVCISAPVSGLDTALNYSKVHYLFRFNHCLFDGIAARQIVAMVFQNLALEISSVPLSIYDDFDWKKSTCNLPPAFVELMDSEQDLSGPRFDRAVYDHMSLMKVKSDLGLKPRQSEPRRPQTEFYTFTDTESHSIRASICSRLQPGNDITHLAMGAVLLALTKANSIQSTSVFSTISVIDGRRYLKKDYKQGDIPYIASCQTPAIFLFKNVHELAISSTSSKVEVRERLERATELARNWFISNLATPCKLSISVPVMEYGAVLAAMSQEKVIIPQMETPVFASDGIIERWIPRELFCNSGEKIIDVDDIYCFSNRSSSSVSVRLSCWRDCIRLSVDYNEGCHKKEDMVAYLNEIANIMLAIMG